MYKSNLTIRDLCMISLFTAVIVVMAQISIPMPFGVPMTMQTFAISLAGIVLGSKRGAFASFIYMLLGAIGLPVFSNFTGGWQSFVGPTGGFLLSFPLMAYIVGLGFEFRSRSKSNAILGLIIGTVVNFVCGTFLFCLLTKSSLVVGLTTCVLPFIPATILKLIFAYLLGSNMKRRLQTFL